MGGEPYGGEGKQQANSSVTTMISSSEVTAQPRDDQRRAYGVALCFAMRSCGGELVVGGEDNSKATIFCHNKRKAKSTGKLLHRTL
ncbi:hypothetical protein AVEN_259347-1 [Araneus ventricosus]|uniref:Uncharacterized protein n=1 Tax=Araneus ventricosus TaxID=182803 RepID=A0A4Y2DTK5_ARAVE|nr:hypothetical protein AVEN_259347-1 [Araneus ventricosus]